MIWEYKVVTMEYRRADLEERLTRLGKDDWELVTLQPMDEESSKFIFKRPKQTASFSGTPAEQERAWRLFQET